MSYEVYINHEKVDIFDDFELPITLQVFDVLTGEATLADYTKTIKLPITNTNARVFGFPHILESQSTKTRSTLHIRVLKNGIEIIPFGDCLFSGVQSGNIEAIIYFGNYHFFKQINDKTLQDLDLSDLDHNWNKANIDSRGITTPALDPVVYALIEFGDYILAWVDLDALEEEDYDDIEKSYLTKIINYQSLLPSVKVSYLMDKILESTGYRIINFDPSNLPDPYDNMYLPIISMRPNDVTRLQAAQYSVYMNQRHVGEQFWKMMHSTVGIDYYGFCAFLFDETILEYADNVKVVEVNPLISYTAFRIGCNGNYPYSISINFEPLTADHAWAKFKIVLGSYTDSLLEEGSYQKNYTVVDESEEFYIGNSGPAVNKYLIGRADFMAGDHLVCIVERTDMFEGSSYDATPAIDLIPDHGWSHFVISSYSSPELIPLNSCPILTEFGYGYNIPIAENLPELNQKDFIKAILGYFGGVVVSSSIERRAELKYIEDIFKTSNAIDWSNKIDLTEYSVVHKLDQLGKKNWFKYVKDDKDFLGAELELGGHLPYDGYFEIENSGLLDNEKDYIKAMFSPSKMVQRVDVDIYVPHIKLMNAGFRQIGTPNARIILIDLYATSRTAWYKSDIEGEDKVIIGSHNELRAFFQLDDAGVYSSLAGGKTLNYQEFIDEHYNKLISLYAGFKMPECYINLDEKDVATFSKFVPIWIEQFHSYFYVNRIIDYTDGLTKVELIKLY